MGGKLTERPPSREETPEIVGAEGGPLGLTETEAPEARPVPNEFTAETWKTYAVSLVRPVTTVPVVAETPSAKVVQLVGSEAGAYCTM